MTVVISDSFQGLGQNDHWFSDSSISGTEVNSSNIAIKLYYNQSCIFTILQVPRLDILNQTIFIWKHVEFF